MAVSHRPLALGSLLSRGRQARISSFNRGTSQLSSAKKGGQDAQLAAKVAGAAAALVFSSCLAAFILSLIPKEITFACVRIPCLHLEG
jgi:hypothetical protein